MLVTGTVKPSAPALGLAAAALAASVIITLIVLAPRGGANEPMPSWTELPADVRGTYVLDDGQHLTLWGTGGQPNVEIGGQVTGLMADGPDRYVAMDGHALSIERNREGAVSGVTMHEDGGARFAARAPLHTETPVRFTSDGATLTGTVFLPTGPGPHPGIALAHGAGPVRRQQSLWLPASHLARNGVAALVYDKRGVGESTGDYASATFDDLTADLLAAVDVLAKHPAIDPQRIGVLGFSQGGWPIAQAAQASDEIAFVVAHSPSGFSPGDQQAWLHGSMLAARGFNERAMTVADRVDRMLYSSLDLIDAGLMPPLPNVPGFWFHALDLDLASADLWEGVRQPVLAVWGELDCQVPAHDSARILGEALQRGGNDDVTVVMLPDADHSLTLVEECGHETGLADHGAMRYADGALELTARWITGGSLDAEPVEDAAESTVLGWHVPPPARAPWYGTLAAQALALLALLALFATATLSWAVRRNGHLAGAAALSGLLATIFGFAAFAENAILGGTHATFLLGGPTVDDSSALLTLGSALVILTAALVLAAAIRTRPATRRLWLIGAATALLIPWAAYWQLLPV